MVENPIDLIAKVSGDVTTVGVSESMHVEPNQILVELDSEEYIWDRQRMAYRLKFIKKQLEILQEKRMNLVSIHKDAEKVYRLRESEQQRQAALHQENYISQSRLDDAAAELANLSMSKIQSAQRIVDLDEQESRLAMDLKQTRIDLGKLNRQVERTQLTAPEAGFVSQLHVAEGSYVSSGALVASLIPDKGVRLQAVLPTSLHERLKQQDSVEVSLVLDGHEIPAEVEYTRPYLGDRSRSIEAVLSVESTEQILPIGRRHRLYVSLPPVDSSYLVPVRSLYPGGYIYVVQSGRLVRLDVSVAGYYFGADRETEVVVVGENLPAEAQLVTEPLVDAVHGMQVRVQDG